MHALYNLKYLFAIIIQIITCYAIINGKSVVSVYHNFGYVKSDNKKWSDHFATNHLWSLLTAVRIKLQWKIFDIWCLEKYEFNSNYSY